MKVSEESNQPTWPGRGLRVKVNLLTFKVKNTKDAVAYHSWQWDIAIFCCSGWDDQHLLPYVFQSLQGFPGDLVRSLGKDTTMKDILQMLDEHYSMAMMFNTWVRSSIPSSKDQGRMWANSWQPRSWKDGQKPEILYSWRPPQLQDQTYPLLRHQGTCFPPSSWREVIPSAPNQLLWKVTMLQKTQAWRQKRKKRPSLQLERTQKPQLELEKHISQLGILSVLAMKLSSIRGKLKLFWNGSPDHLVRDCVKDLSKTTQKVSLNTKERTMKKGGWAPKKQVVTQPASPDEAPSAWRPLKKFPS